MNSKFVAIDPSRYFRDFIDNDIRLDGRKLDGFRAMSIDVSSIHTADGSAVVKMGNTLVVCGIKAELGKPKAETSNEGYLIVNVELPALCSNKYQPGPPSDEAQVLSTFLDQVLKNSNCLNLKDLSISNDNLAWVLHLDTICLNQDGCVFDACVVASVAALRSLKLPQVKFDVDTKEKEVDMTNTKPLTLGALPIASTLAIFDSNKILTDPTSEEESLCTGVVTIVITMGSNETNVIRQPGSTPLTTQQLQSCICNAKKKTKLVQQLLNTAMGDPER